MFAGNSRTNFVLNVGLVGYGYWGPNLYRNFSINPAFRVAGIAERSAEIRERLLKTTTGIMVMDDANELIAKPGIDAVAIATPVASHYALVRDALDAGKHVLVEKPLCTTSEEGLDLVARAERHRRVLMVDHTFLFTGAVQTLQKFCRSGNLGDICYFDSVRVNLGLFQPDINVLWDLAPHDLSILDSLIDDEPVHVEASGYCHVNFGLPDMAFLTIHYPRNQVAHLNLSWMSPVKIRRVVIGGSRKMLIWDDLDPEEKIKIYNSGIEFQPEPNRSTILPDYRIGDIFSPRVPKHEALTGVVEHFGQVIAGLQGSIMDGRKGLKVVRTIERAQLSLDSYFKRIGITGARSYG
jgi:predicted dehydrogenase